MKAVILAAGKGTRLQGLTKDRPKALMDVGGITAIEHIIQGLKGADIDQLIVVIGYHGEMIQELLKDGSKLGVSIEYVEQKVLNGTGSALHLTKDVVGPSPFVMTYGDIIISPGNYRDMRSLWEQIEADGLLAVNWVEDPYAGAAVYFDENKRVTKIIEKPPQGTSTTNWNNAGLFVFSPIIFTYTGRLTPSVRGEYELSSAIAQMLAEQRKLYAYPLEGHWGDIGTVEELERIQTLMREKE
ncbi:MAG TPA: nucleotidyltransferase family protein [Firmicutes bacterium]|nr:nucleotidyltransferase family protein [Bacillota bacterium]